MKIDVLDKGFVEKMMCADSDLTVVNCARVSFGKESGWENFDPEAGGGKRYYLSARDTKLINYLARNNHWTPFAHPIIRLRVKAPIFIRTQLFKHKFGAVENEVSRRYVDDEPEFYEPSEYRGRPKEGNTKQGSSGVVDNLCSMSWCRSHDEDGNQEFGFSYEEPSEWFSWQEDHWKQTYEELQFAGVCPEQARLFMPQGMYTEWIWTGSLAFFARVYKQRSDPHAQWEAQQYAKAIGEIVEPLFPVSWAALTQ